MNIYEGPPEICANCNKVVETAYGDPDAEEDYAIAQGVNMEEEN